MSMMTIQTDNTPNVTENSASSEKTLDDDIRELESKAEAEEAETRRATRATNALLIVTGIVAALTALAGLWGTRASARLRVTENLLNSLRMTKVRADADKEAKRVESGAREREAQIKADAEVKIVEAHAVGKQADEKAGKANERAAEIEKQNLELRGGVANLEKEAADAKRAYLELQERFRPRTLSREQRARLIKLLGDPLNGTPLVVEFAPGNKEAREYAQQIHSALVEAGWSEQNWLRTARYVPPIGIILHGEVADEKRIHKLSKALIEIGISVDTGTGSGGPMRPFTTILVIGPKQ